MATQSTNATRFFHLRGSLYSNSSLDPFLKKRIQLRVFIDIEEAKHPHGTRPTIETENKEEGTNQKSDMPNLNQGPKDSLLGQLQPSALPTELGSGYIYSSQKRFHMDYAIVLGLYMLQLLGIRTKSTTPDNKLADPTNHRYQNNTAMRPTTSKLMITMVVLSRPSTHRAEASDAITETQSSFQRQKPWRNHVALVAQLVRAPV